MLFFLVALVQFKTVFNLWLHMSHTVDLGYNITQEQLKWLYDTETLYHTTSKSLLETVRYI